MANQIVFSQHIPGSGGLPEAEVTKKRVMAQYRAALGLPPADEEVAISEEQKEAEARQKHEAEIAERNRLNERYEEWQRIVHNQGVEAARRYMAQQRAADEEAYEPLQPTRREELQQMREKISRALLPLLKSPNANSGTIAELNRQRREIDLELDTLASLGE